MNEALARRPLRTLLIAAYWAAPATLCLLFFYQGLWCWFHKDDFSLLLLAQLPDREFWPKLWSPRAQGTFRPWSERVFFYYFHGWFGLDAFPYRLLVFGTQILNLWLLAAVTNRLTGWRGAGLLAASLWGLHHSLANSLSWTSAYNQVLCAFFVLLSFWLFLRFVSSGRLGYYLAQFATFLLGFGALEAIVVYPVIVMAYVLLFRRRLWLYVAPMLLAAAGLAWMQWQAAARAPGEIYETSFSLGVLITSLQLYSTWALAALQPAPTAVTLGAPLLLLVAYQAYRRDFLGLFFLAWFLIALGPYLPVAGHRSQYYLVVPALGLAMLVGWAARLGWEMPGSKRLAPLALMAAGIAYFLSGSVLYSKGLVGYNHRWSVAARQLVSDVAQARSRFPNKTILLADMPHDLFYMSIYHDIFRVVHIFDVYLAPGNDQIQPLAGYLPVEKFTLPPAETLRALSRGTVVVYDASGPRLTNVTEQYAALAPLKLNP